MRPCGRVMGQENSITCCAKVQEPLRHAPTWLTQPPDVRRRLCRWGAWTSADQTLAEMFKGTRACREIHQNARGAPGIELDAIRRKGEMGLRVPHHAAATARLSQLTQAAIESRLRLPWLRPRRWTCGCGGAPSPDPAARRRRAPCSRAPARSRSGSKARRSDARRRALCQPCSPGPQTR